MREPGTFGQVCRPLDHEASFILETAASQKGEALAGAPLHAELRMLSSPPKLVAARGGLNFKSYFADNHHGR
jgi:hypothetical protein